MGGTIADAGLFINWSLRVGTTARRCASFEKYRPLSRDLVFDIRLLELWVVNEVLKQKRSPPNRDFYSTVVMWNKIGRNKAKKPLEHTRKLITSNDSQYALQKHNVGEEECDRNWKQNGHCCNHLKKELDVKYRDSEHQVYHVQSNMLLQDSMPKGFCQEAACFSPKTSNFTGPPVKSRGHIQISSQKDFIVGVSHQDYSDMNQQRPSIAHVPDDRRRTTTLMTHPNQSFSVPDSMVRAASMSTTSIPGLEQGSATRPSRHNVSIIEPHQSMRMSTNHQGLYDQRMSQLQRASMMSSNVPIYEAETPQLTVKSSNHHNTGFGPGEELSQSVGSYPLNTMAPQYPSGGISVPTSTNMGSRQSMAIPSQRGELSPPTIPNGTNQIMNPQTTSHQRRSELSQIPTKVEQPLPAHSGELSALIGAEQNKERILSSILSPSPCRLQSNCHFCVCSGKRINVICSCNQENLPKTSCYCSKDDLELTSKTKKKRRKSKESDKASKKEAKRKEKEEKARKKKEMKEQKAREKESLKHRKKSKDDKAKKKKSKKGMCTCCNCAEHPTCNCLADHMSSDESNVKGGCCKRKKKSKKDKSTKKRKTKAEKDCDDSGPEHPEYCNHPLMPCPGVGTGGRCDCGLGDNIDAYKSTQRPTPPAHVPSTDACDTRSCTSRKHNSCTCYQTGAICNCNCVKKKSHADSTDNAIHVAPALMVPSEVGDGDSQEKKLYDFLAGSSNTQFTRLPTSLTPSGNIVIDFSKRQHVQGTKESGLNRHVVPPCVLYLDCTRVKDLCVIIRNNHDEPS